MLLQFSFSNYKSFRDESVLNLIAPNTAKYDYYSHKTNLKNTVLKTATVYGANASGKTKLFEAFDFMKSVVCPPSGKDKIPVLDYWQSRYDPFRLNTCSSEENSFFEVVFIIDNTQYRYGFELNYKGFVSEWLYLKTKRETNVFSRDNNSNITYTSKHFNAKIAENIISANMISSRASFLAILGIFNEPLATKVVDWFRETKVISANDIRSSLTYPIPVLENNVNKSKIVNFMKAFDFNIEDMILHELPVLEIPEKIKEMIGEDNLKGKLFDGVNTLHKQYNGLYERVNDVWFSMEKDESYGTNRLFALSWAIISSLKNGTVLFIDEFDSGIHPSIARIIVELYYKCNSNAQLVINTQNASMLNYETQDGKKLFLKHQVYLVDKNRYGESILTPLSDFSNDMRSNLEKLYLEGDFGGVPYISIEQLLDLIKQE
ncbi:MAG: ATP-binding protein [Bacteroidales bacterium]|nr:ATP-binding protein [Bacteroidales bacterium]